MTPPQYSPQACARILELRARATRAKACTIVTSGQADINIEFYGAAHTMADQIEALEAIVKAQREAINKAHAIFADRQRLVMLGPRAIAPAEAILKQALALTEPTDEI